MVMVLRNKAIDMIRETRLIKLPSLIMVILFILSSSFSAFSQSTGVDVEDEYWIRKAVDFVFSEDFPNFHKRENLEAGRLVFAISNEIKVFNSLLFSFVIPFSDASIFPQMKYYRYDHTSPRKHLESDEEVAVLFSNKITPEFQKNKMIKFDNCEIYIIEKDFIIEKVYAYTSTDDEDENFVCGATAMFATYGFLNMDKVAESLSKSSGAPYYIMQVLYGNKNSNLVKPGANKEKILKTLIK